MHTVPSSANLALALALSVSPWTKGPVSANPLPTGPLLTGPLTGVSKANNLLACQCDLPIFTSLLSMYLTQM